MNQSHLLELSMFYIKIVLIIYVVNMVKMKQYACTFSEIFQGRHHQTPA